MGGTSKTSQQSQQSTTTAPWQPAQASITGILDKLSPLVQNSGLSGAATGALDNLQNTAQQGNPFASQITGFANNLLNGGGASDQAGALQGGLDTYRNQLSPYANGSMIGNNPALKAQLDQIMSDVGNSVNSQFAAAGRDMSGANQQAYGRGVASGIAPVLANQYNQDVNNQINAAGQLYGAQNSTSGLLSGMNQQGLSNQLQGVSTANDALAAQNYGDSKTLDIERLRQQLPAETLGLLAQIGIPIAGLGGTSNSTASSQGEHKMSGAQQFATIAQGIGSLNSGTGGGIGKMLWGV